MKMLYYAGPILLWLLSGCTFTKKITSGNDAFAVKQYAVAVQLFQEEYAASDHLEDRAAKAYLTGQCYELMRQPAMAAPWYKKAFEHNYGPPALEHYAEMLRQTEQYPQAIEAYEELMNKGTDIQRYRGMITLCNQAIQWKQDQDKSPYQIEPVTFNSPGDDYAPVVIGPDLLLLTSDRTVSTGNSAYPWTGRKFSDLFSVNLATGIVQPFDHTLNTADNEGTAAFTRDRSEMYFTRCYQASDYNSYCKILMCRAHGGSWSEPEPLPFIREGINYGHPVMTGNDSILIFSSDNPEGAGGYDLYFSVRTMTGWNEPAPLSERINSIGNERFPSMHMDTLYFSSDHHPGLGGLDIFKSYLDANREWTPPVNLKAPVNSGWDDFSFTVDTFNIADGNILEHGYFASARNATNGDDIFHYARLRTSPTETVADKARESSPLDYHIYLAVKTYEPIFATPGDPNSDRIGKRPLPETVLHISEGMAMRREKTDPGGLLILELAWNKSYEIQARKAGYLIQNRAFSTTQIRRDPENPVTTFNMEIVLDPIFEGTEIVLRNIYYDYDEWYIREDAKPALDSLARMLRDNPSLRIQLSSHTDCRGEDVYNLDLSQKRAQSAVTYLVSQGIREERLVPVGYGERRLAVDCLCELCTEAQHQENRRTTFKIMENQ